KILGARPTFPSSANDDHPPTDITHAQTLVTELFFAIFDSPAWKDILFLIVYDEHGGFHDHVPPPPVASPESPDFTTLGLRVPAMVVSPWVGPGLVSHRQFDHASIIHTILRRFCSQPDGSIPDLGDRVTKSEHLGHLLTEKTARFPSEGVEVHLP